MGLDGGILGVAWRAGQPLMAMFQETIDSPVPGAFSFWA
jgi:hypothetical protein